MRVLFLCVAVLFVFTSSSVADPVQHEMRPAPKALDILKELSGTWRGKHKNHEGKEEDVRLTYRVVSNGTTVEERIFEGTEKEMVTLYHGADNGKDILMTHYCGLGNQPTLRAKAPDGKSLNFSFVRGVGIDPKKDGYMGALKIDIKNKDQFTQAWTYFEDGKAQNESIFRFSRVTPNS